MRKSLLEYWCPNAWHWLDLLHTYVSLVKFENTILKLVEFLIAIEVLSAIGHNWIYSWIIKNRRLLNIIVFLTGIWLTICDLRQNLLRYYLNILLMRSFMLNINLSLIRNHLSCQDGIFVGLYTAHLDVILHDFCLFKHLPVV
jgi:hypothetical protein